MAGTTITADAGRNTKEVWKDSGGSTVNTLTFTFDYVGNETVAADSHGTYTLTYDSLNRVSKVAGLFGVTFTFTYDAVSNRTKVEDSFGGVQTSTYDAINRQTNRKFGGVGMTTLSWDTSYTDRNQIDTITRYSDLTGSTKIGETNYSYDSVGRVENLKHKNGSGTTLANYTYTYDLASRVTSEKLNGSTTSYVYDDTNQLTDDAVKSYSYDSNGNRTMAGYTTGTGNRITNDGVYTYTYDNEGNLTKKSKGASAETWTYTYDNRDQLVGVTERSTDGGGTLLFQGTYTYDVFNNRVHADEYVNGSGTTTTKSVYADQGTVFADLTSGNAMQTRYLHQDDSQYSPVVARIESGTRYWNLDDRQGSVRNVVDAAGSLVNTLTYDGFGNKTAESDSTKTGAMAYAGYRFDRQMGTLAANERIYDPVSGRWLLQDDPIRWQAGDLNLRRYVGNGPTNGTDPSGEVWPILALAIAGGWILGPGAKPVQSPTRPDDIIPVIPFDKRWQGDVAGIFIGAAAGAIAGAGAFGGLGAPAAAAVQPAWWTTLKGTDLAIMRATAGATTRTAPFMQQVGQLGWATMRVTGNPTNQVHVLGTINGAKVWGSITSGTGICSIKGVTMVVKKVGKAAFDILGPLIP